MKTAKELFLEMLEGISMDEEVDVGVLQTTVSESLGRMLSENPNLRPTYYRVFIDIAPFDNPGRARHKRDKIKICIEWTEKDWIGVESHRLTKIGNGEVFSWDGPINKRVVVNETAGILF